MTKRTPLYEEHVKLGAKMVPFAGYEMPVQYTGVIDEHNAVRQSAGLFDVSHMGEFEFLGPHALPFLDYLTANDVVKLTDGQAQYSLLLNEQGGVVDDILVYRINENHFLMVVNAANIEKDFKWVHKNQPTQAKVEVNNISDHVCLLALQG
ncbi:MAG: glycine cleavage system aminomethyltransferase GcvT, partial [Deltaproteobacteria bacterium]|nr:glycine cleavage system aminomethyltransferase GcvT [Deltaproteobacteria bacterium]